MSSREEFETWASKQKLGLTYGDCGYVFSSTEMAWRAWQAMESKCAALLDELEAAEKKTVEIPTFDGYVPHVARELQAAFRIACDNAGINVAAAAGKGE